MLTIAKLGVGQESYYLSKVARGVEDYYSGEGEAVGEWIGRGAERLGLDGEVDGDELRSLLAGMAPGGEHRLAGREGCRRVPGWDLTFSAPKSVSVLWALGEHDTAGEVVAAHEAAVRAGVEYLERHATVSRRRIAGRIEQVSTQGLVIAAFRHRTSRAGDPQLHTHALAVNAVERVDGGWGAVHSPVIYQHARTAGFVYQALLRSELTERPCVGWTKVVNGCAETGGRLRRGRGLLRAVFVVGGDGAGRDRRDGGGLSAGRRALRHASAPPCGGGRPRDERITWESAAGVVACRARAVAAGGRAGAGAGALGSGRSGGAQRCPSARPPTAVQTTAVVGLADRDNGGPG